MTDEPNDAQNAAGAGGDPATPPADGAQNAGADENQGRLIAGLQEKAARVNEAERKARELAEENERLRRAQSPAASAPGVDPRHKRVRDTYDYATGRMGDPDPVAGVAIDALTEIEMMRQREAERDALDEIEDDATRRKVKAHLADNRKQGRELDVKAARAEVEAAEAEELRAENARLQAALKQAQAPAGAAPPTMHRDVPAATLKARTFGSLDEYQEATKGLSTFERLKLDEAIDRGEVKVSRE